MIIQPVKITLQGELKKGMASGKFPHAENTLKAIRAVTRKDTAPLIRAYWSGYLCLLTSREIDDLIRSFIQDHGRLIEFDGGVVISNF